MKRAFTLVELLVVISIVSMLASIVMVQISLAQANGRDSVRTQQIRQIDLATKLYVETNKKAPSLLTGCDVLSQNPNTLTADDVSSCFAVSTAAAGPQKDAWDAFKAQLQPFMNVPEDPCGSCSSGSNFPIGYTYVAPLAMQYYCVTAGCVVTNESYQLYAPLERNSVPSGNSGSSSNYAPSSQSLSGGSDTTAPSVPTGLAITLDPKWTGGALGIHLTWNASTDNQGVVGYKLNSDSNYGSYDEEGNFVPSAPTPGTSRDLGGQSWMMGSTYCDSVRAFDAAGNASAFSATVCTPSFPLFFSVPANVTVVRQGNQATVNWSAVTNNTTDAVLKYRVYYPSSGGYLIAETDQLSVTYDAAGWGNCVRVAPIGYIDYDGFMSPVYNDNNGLGLPPIVSSTACASGN